jgi:hypothetical protein
LEHAQGQRRQRCKPRCPSSAGRWARSASRLAPTSPVRVLSVIISGSFGRQNLSGAE